MYLEVKRILHLEKNKFKGRTIIQLSDYTQTEKTTTLVVSDNDVLLLAGAMKYVSLYFPKTTFSLCISAAVYMCASAFVFKVMKQERFRAKPCTNTGRRGEKRETVYKAGWGDISQATGWN